jgi:Ca2+-binding EF-hand superfamily protein
VFSNYDKDKSNSLDTSEVASLINDALKKMGNTRTVSDGEVKGFIQAVDVSGDGKIQKPELYEIFKRVINS